LKTANEGVEGNVIFNGMFAAALGLILAHLYKIVYFNHVKRKAAIFILPAAVVFISIGAFMEDMEINTVAMPFYVIAVIAFGVLFGIIHAAAVRYRIKHPKNIDPYSKKAIKLRDREIMEDAERMRGYIDDDTIKKRREQLEKERLEREEKQRRFRDGG